MGNCCMRGGTATENESVLLLSHQKNAASSNECLSLPPLHIQGYLISWSASLTKIESSESDYSVVSGTEFVLRNEVNYRPDSIIISMSCCFQRSEADFDKLDEGTIKTALEQAFTDKTGPACVSVTEAAEQSTTAADSPKEIKLTMSLPGCVTKVTSVEVFTVLSDYLSTDYKLIFESSGYNGILVSSEVVTLRMTPNEDLAFAREGTLFDLYSRSDGRCEHTFKAKGNAYLCYNKQGVLTVPEGDNVFVLSVAPRCLIFTLIYYFPFTVDPGTPISTTAIENWLQRNVFQSYNLSTVAGFQVVVPNAISYPDTSSQRLIGLTTTVSNVPTLTATSVQQDMQQYMMNNIKTGGVHYQVLFPPTM